MLCLRIHQLRKRMKTKHQMLVGYFYYLQELAQLDMEYIKELFQR